MTLLATLSIGLGATLGPSAPKVSPIPPCPLRRLVHSAEFIVTARVEEADPRRAKLALAEVPEWLGPQSVVTLVIDGLVKGDPGVRALEQVNFGHMCPAPAHYVVGQRVLAFLDRAKQGAGFYTHALSYGAKTLGDDDMALYLERIREQLALEQVPEGDARLAAQVEWLVKCAEQTATRWEGAYELAPAGDGRSADDEEGATPDFAAHLSGQQRTRLRNTLLQGQAFGPGEGCLEELFRNDPDPRLQAWLVTRLRACYPELETQSYGAARTLIERIVRRDERPEVRATAASLKELDEDGPARVEAARRRLSFF